MQSLRSRRASSENERKAKKGIREKYGIEIPKPIKAALALDLKNGDNKWAMAIAKEMKGLKDMNVFKILPQGTRLGKTWQFDPMQMIFDIKEDLSRKARLVVGGHVIDPLYHEKRASVVQTLTVRLLLLIAEHEKLQTIGGDIGQAFTHAACREKVYS